MRFILRVLIGAFALWLTTLIVGGASDGVWVEPYEDSTLATVLTYLLIAFIFGVINATVGTVIRIVSFPLYILTLGLFSLVVNALLLYFVAWISDWMGFGLHIEGFWWGVLGALVLSVITGLLGLIVRPARRT